MIFVYLNLTLFIQGYVLISIRERRNEMIEETIRYLYVGEQPTSLACW
jgi:NADH:ubiquinone oxidoreductase subunit 2 (subunit N)